eukprot:2093146-Prymnesium_polylepis.1
MEFRSGDTWTADFYLATVTMALFCLGFPVLTAVAAYQLRDGSPIQRSRIAILRDRYRQGRWVMRPQFKPEPSWYRTPATADPRRWHGEW